MLERSERGGMKSGGCRAPEQIQHGAIQLRGESWTGQMRYEQKKPQPQRVTAYKIAVENNLYGDLKLQGIEKRADSPLVKKMAPRA